MPLTLTLVQDIAPGVALRAITPDRLASLSARQIAQLPLQCGGQRVALGDLFRCSGDAADHQLRLIGDFSQFDYVAAEMRSGSLTVEGSVGDHAGAAMSGGVLSVLGDVGDFVGSPNPGEKRGLQGGAILIHGAAGRQLGVCMRRGMIAVAGDVGELCGYRMLAGTIVIGGKLGSRAGLRMKRGTIVALTPGGTLPATFHRDCVYHPPMMKLLQRELERLHVPLPAERWAAEFQLYSGDFAEMSRGEILTPNLS